MDWTKIFDHTNLNPFATEGDIEGLAREGARWEFKSICVYPTWVAFAKKCLIREAEAVGTTEERLPLICSVVGFPSGAHETVTKIKEGLLAIRNGAQELDVVIPVGLFLTGTEAAQYKVREEIHTLVSILGDQAKIKVILETGLLSINQIELLCGWCVESGAAFVKTSTGFGPRGASIKDVEIMAASVKGSSTQVKASGGIRSADNAVALYQKGATRLGTSETIRVLSDLGWVLHLQSSGRQPSPPSS